MKTTILAFTIAVFSASTTTAQQPVVKPPAIKTDSVPAYQNTPPGYQNFSPDYHSNPANNVHPVLIDTAHDPVKKMWNDSTSGPKKEKK